MNKRLRRKKRVGEFADYGFVVDACWSFHVPVLLMERDDPVMLRIDKAWDDVIDFLEARGLDCGGGSNAETFGIIVEKMNRTKTHGADNPTNEDREAVTNYFMTSPDFKDVVIGPWVDLGQDEESKKRCLYKG